MTKRARQEKTLIGFVEQADSEEMRVLRLVLDAITNGGESQERILRGTAWYERPEAEALSYLDTLVVMEAIATGNLDIAPDYIVDSLREHVFCTEGGGVA